MVVFRPFAGEVILAKVKSSDEEGIRRMWLHINLHGLHTQLKLYSVDWLLRRYARPAFLPARSLRVVSKSSSVLFRQPIRGICVQ